jgi:hypothetical protein
VSDTLRLNLEAKIAGLRRENRELRRATSAEENALLRTEAREYRKALSNILHRLDVASSPLDLDPDALRSVVENALALNGVKLKRREAIKALAGDGGQSNG